jgi:hypothetical protein
MDSSAFKNLLDDLYTQYNPDKISDIDRFVVNYNGKEFDAVKAIYIRYNFKQSPFYNPELGTDKHVKKLIDSYSNGTRVLSKDFINKIEISKKQEEENLRAEKEKEKEKEILESQEKINEKLKETNDSLKKELESYKKEIVNIKEEFDKKIEDANSSNSNYKVEIVEKDPIFDIQLKCNFDEQEINLPEKYYFLNSSIGQRILTKDKSGNIVGIEIIDILDDFLAESEKPIREIILEKR